jgi:hypothetical protein
MELPWLKAPALSKWIDNGKKCVEIIKKSL